jgi:quercetin dioxygenase-like cupin family protein
VGLLYGGPGIRAEWVSKRGEAVDPNWSSQDEVDFLCVLAGHLRVEFEREDFSSTTRKSGQVLILPPGVRCRACRWPRETTDAAVFVAVYPAVDAEGDV